jgi:hypothetical protein
MMSMVWVLVVGRETNSLSIMNLGAGSPWD